MAAPSSAVPTLDQVLGEAFHKAAQIVLSARIYQPGRQPEQPHPKRKAWFNLELDELENANKSLEAWRKDVGRPLVLEVFLQPWGTAEPRTSQPGQQAQAPVETLLEQWVFHYQPQLPQAGPSLSRSQLSRLNPTSIYKRLVIMLRSLFCYVRVLPAYRMFRACKRQRGSNFTIGYRVSGTLPRRTPAAASSPSTAAAAAAATPFAAASVQSSAGSGRSRGGGSGSSSSSRRALQQFEFAPVDTPYGQFKVSVFYAPASKVTILEQTTSPPPLPQIIADYVGGPARPPGQLPLRHTMSAALCSEQRVAAAAATQQQQQQLPQRSATAGEEHWQRGGGARVPASPTAAGAAAGLQRQGSAFAPIPRYAWSSAMRISPNRLSPGMHSFQQHPAAAAGGQAPPGADRGLPATPYGSAPQLAPLQHSPQLLRALSMQARLPGTASPRKPPLPPSRALDSGSPAAGGGAQHAGAQPIPYSRLAPSAEGEEGQLGSEAGSSARQSSAPVSIPGREQGGRRMRSSGDLWGMHQPAELPKPLSAPAASHLPLPGAQPHSHGTAGTGSHTTDASLPPGPLPLIPGSALESESSGSAASSAMFPTSCSPQLPFAFTPSAQSLASYGSKGPLQDSAVRPGGASPRLRRASPSFAGSGPLQQSASVSPASWDGPGRRPAPAASSAGSSAASPGAAAGEAGGGSAAPGAGAGRQHSVQFAEELVVTGREVPASSALVRRASWSARSSAHLRKSSMEGGGVGYSVSPMQDPLLESVMGSTPRQYSLGVSTPQYPGQLGGPSGRPGALISRTSSGVSAAGTPPPLLTYPPPAGAEAGKGPELEGVESDVLPFALDGDNPRTSPAPTSAAQQQPLGQAGGFGSPAVLPRSVPAPSPTPPAGQPGAGAAGAGQAASSDAAVGAFVRLLQEAPPLSSFGGAAPAPATVSPATAASPAASAAGGGGGASRLTLQAALKQFELLSERLQSRGVVMGPVDL